MSQKLGVIVDRFALILALIIVSVMFYIAGLERADINNNNQEKDKRLRDISVELVLCMEEKDSLRLYNRQLTTLSFLFGTTEEEETKDEVGFSPFVVDEEEY